MKYHIGDILHLKCKKTGTKSTVTIKNINMYKKQYMFDQVYENQYNYIDEIYEIEDVNHFEKSINDDFIITEYIPINKNNCSEIYLETHTFKLPEEFTIKASNSSDLYCSCGSDNVVDVWINKEKSHYCRGCKKERL